MTDDIFESRDDDDLRFFYPEGIGRQGGDVSGGESHNILLHNNKFIIGGSKEEEVE